MISLHPSFTGLPPSTSPTTTTTTCPTPSSISSSLSPSVTAAFSSSSASCPINNHSRTAHRLIPCSTSHKWLKQTTTTSKATTRRVRPHKPIISSNNNNSFISRFSSSINRNNNSNSNNNNNNLNNNNNNNNIDYYNLANILSCNMPELSPSLITESNEPLRILFLISDTGGGHRASAQALATGFKHLYADKIECNIIDFWTEIVGKPFRQMPEQYSFLAKNPFLWKVAWTYGKFPVTRRITEEFSNFIGNQNFRNVVLDYKPNLIVSVHPLTQFIPLRVLKSLYKENLVQSKIPFVTVCTDLAGAHPTWFHKDVDLCFIPTTQIKKIAVKCGLSNSQLKLFGLPVRPSFSISNNSSSQSQQLTNTNTTTTISPTINEKQKIRKQLKLNEYDKIILIVGGGDGVGGVDRISNSIATQLSNYNIDNITIIIVCGKNEKLKNKLQVKNNWPNNVNVRVHGFVNNMNEWMIASDILVSKAGPGTIAESLICGLPIVLSGFLPGQEKPNVDFVINSGVGDFHKNPAHIAQIVYNWIVTPNELERRAKIAKQLGRPNATYDIVKEIAKLVNLNSSSDKKALLGDRNSSQDGGEIESNLGGNETGSIV